MNTETNTTNNGSGISQETCNPFPGPVDVSFMFEFPPHTYEAKYRTGETSAVDEDADGSLHLRQQRVVLPRAIVEFDRCNASYELWKNPISAYKHWTIMNYLYNPATYVLGEHDTKQESSDKRERMNVRRNRVSWCTVVKCFEFHAEQPVNYPARVFTTSVIKPLKSASEIDQEPEPKSADANIDAPKNELAAEPTDNGFGDTRLEENAPGNEGVDSQKNGENLFAGLQEQQNPPTVSENATTIPHSGEKITPPPYVDGQLQPTQRNSYCQDCDRCWRHHETGRPNRSSLDFNAGPQRNAVRLELEIQLVGPQNTYEDEGRDQWSSSEFDDSDDSWEENNAAVGHENDRQYPETDKSDRNCSYCDEERAYSAGNEHSARPTSSDDENPHRYDDGRSSPEECANCSCHADPIHVGSPDKTPRNVLKLKPGKHVTIPLSWFNQSSARSVILELAGEDMHENRLMEEKRRLARAENTSCSKRTSHPSVHKRQSSDGKMLWK